MNKKHFTSKISFALAMMMLLGSQRLFADGNSGTVSNGQDVNSQSVNQGGSAPSGSGDNFLFTGSFLYSVPIEVPPGISGMQPSLSIDYNSSQGNGWVGTGWDLSVGSIQRSTKNGPPKYNTSDNFTLTLKGHTQDLTAISADGSGNQSYQAKIENGFLKFVQAGSQWIVIDKNGTRYFFGESSNSLIQGSAGIYLWALDKVVDRNGNAMTITYTSDQNQLYPLDILYTSNDMSSPARVADRKIHFTLEPRPDPMTSYRSGLYQVMAQRLARIETFVHQNDVWSSAKLYTLNYSISSNRVRSELTSIDLTGRNGTTVLNIPLTKTDYLQTGSGWTPADSSVATPPIHSITLIDTSYGVLSLDNGVRFVDFNGDGRVDMLVGRHETNASRGDWYTLTAYINTASGWQNAGAAWQPPTAFSSIYWGNNNDQVSGYGLPVRIVDVNGDGKPDLMDMIIKKVWINTGSGWDASQGVTWTLPTLVSVQVPNAASYDVVDLNGDGFVDIVYSFLSGSTYNRHVWINNGHGWTQDDSWNIPVGLSIRWGSTTNPYGTRFVDVNADGLPDIIHSFRDLSGIPPNVTAREIYFNTGSGWTLASEKAPSFLASGGPSSGQVWDYGVQFVDVNGDGLLDWTESDQVHFEIPGTVGINLPGGPLYYSRIFLNTGSDWVDARSQFAFPAPFVIQNGANQYFGYSNGFMFLDFNGDGQSDLFQSNAHNGNVTSSVWLSSAKPELVQSVQNPLGGRTEVEYDCSQNISGSHRIPFPIQVLKGTRNLDGRGGSVAMTFSYDQGLFSALPLEFLGFGKVQTTDPDGNTSISYYHQDKDAAGNKVPINALKGNVYKVENYDSAGRILTKQETHWQFSQLMSGKDLYFVRPDKVQSTIYDGSSPFSTEVGLSYDSFGNVTQTAYKGDTVLTGDERTENVEYADPVDQATYMVGFPKRSYAVDPGNGAIISDTKYSYDAKGNLTQSQRRLNTNNTWITTKSEYNSLGQLTAILDPNLNRTETTYDAYGFPSQVKNALGQTVRSVYDPLTGNVISDTDLNNQVTTYQYDPLGRLLSVVGPLDSSDDPSTITDYHDELRGNPFQQYVEKRIRIMNGQAPMIWSKSYVDGLGRTYKTESQGVAGKSVLQESVFNNRGLTSQVSMPYFSNAGPAQWTQTTYDALGRVVLVQKPDNTRVVTSYSGRLTSVQDANGNIHSSEVDAYGRVITRREPSISNPTLYSYDLLGNLSHTVDSLGKKTSFVYDSLGRKLSMVDPNAGSWSYSYDNNGNLIRQTDGRGVVTSLEYDKLNRLTAKNFIPDPSDETEQKLRPLATYRYDETSGRPYSKGRLTTVSDPSGSVAFYHDQLGRVARQVKNIWGNTYEIKTNFDALGHATQITYPNNQTVNYAFDEAGHLSSVANASGTVYAAYSSYDALGRLSGFYQADGKTHTTYNYDPQKFTLAELKVESLAIGTPQALKNWLYTFDSVGNLKTISDALHPERNQSFEYDALYRLTHAQGNYGGQAFTYDSLGNFQTKGGMAYSYEDPNHPYAVTRTGSPFGLAIDASTLVHWNLDPSEFIRPQRGTSPENSERLNLKPAARSTSKESTKSISPTESVARPVGIRTTFVPGRYQQALSFDGSSDLFVLPQTQSLAPNAFTLMLWVKPQAYPKSNFATLISKSTGTELGQVKTGFRLLLDGEGKVIFESAGSTGLGTLITNHSLPKNKWTLVTAAMDGSLLQIYFNEQKQVEGASPGAPLASAVPVVLGGSLDDHNQPVANQFFNGVLDEPRIQGRVWSADEIAAANEAFDGPAVYRYDGNGNMIFKSVGGSTWTYHYDALNRLTRVMQGATRTAAFVYDADGGRVKKYSPAGTTLYIGSLYEQRPDGSMVDHVFGGGGLICDIVTKGGEVQTSYYHADHLGSISLVTDSDGNQLQEIGYTPFGEVDFENGASSLHHKFTGQEQDPETSLHFYKSRYYDPHLGRFISADSIVPSAMDPQSFNRYAYCRNSPVNFVDPDGHLFWVPVVVGAVIGAISAGRATNWQPNYMFSGALVGAIGGAVGSGIGSSAMGVTHSALLSGIIGGAAGGTASGYTGAAMFGGHRGIAMEQGALWGGIAGGLAQGLTMAGIPGAAAQTGGAYLSGQWSGGSSSAREGGVYGFFGAMLGNMLRMAGVDMEGVVPEGTSEDLKEMQQSKNTYETTPEISIKGDNLLWMITALLTDGTSHTWHTDDREYVPGGHRYRGIDSNVPSPENAESYNVKSESIFSSQTGYNIWNNNCTTRFGYWSPGQYYSQNHYVGPSVYWRK